MLTVLFAVLSTPLWAPMLVASSYADSVIDDLLSEVRAIAQKQNELALRFATEGTCAVAPPIPSNCKEATAQSGRSSIHRIQVSGFIEKPFLVACDNATDGGGWTVFQRRVDGEIDFYRGWSEYQTGFGNLNTSFWMGLDKLHALTNACVQELMIRLTNVNGVSGYAKYDAFAIGDEAQDYALTVLGVYSGTTGDSLRYHGGHKFSTKDRDNDASNESNCAVKWEGAWWYGDCFTSNLNGNYTRTDGKGIRWNSLAKGTPMKFAEMMIRPKDNC